MGGRISRNALKTVIKNVDFVPWINSATVNPDVTGCSFITCDNGEEIKVCSDCQDKQEKEKREKKLKAHSIWSAWLKDMRKKHNIPDHDNVSKRFKDHDGMLDPAGQVILNEYEEKIKEMKYYYGDVWGE